MEISNAPRIWLKAFWGFDPSADGYLGFTLPGDRDRFISEARSEDLILIYGADAKETLQEHRRQALGFLSIDPIPIFDRDRQSAETLAPKVRNGWKDKWTFAVPVRRAWKVNRRIEVKHLAPNTYNGAFARVIARRGELLTEDEAAACLKLPVTEVSVFGEPPIGLQPLAESRWHRYLCHHAASSLTSPREQVSTPRAIIICTCWP